MAENVQRFLNEHWFLKISWFRIVFLPRHSE